MSYTDKDNNKNNDSGKNKRQHFSWFTKPA